MWMMKMMKMLGMFQKIHSCLQNVSDVIFVVVDQLAFDYSISFQLIEQDVPLDIGMTFATSLRYCETQTWDMLGRLVEVAPARRTLTWTVESWKRGPCVQQQQWGW